MSKLERLIHEKCPNGVEFKTLQELGEFYSGLSGKKKDDFIDGNAKLITYMNCYKNQALKIDVEDKVKIKDGERQNTLEYGDVIFTGSSENLEEAGLTSVLTIKTDEKLYLNSFCFVFRFNDKDLFLPDFTKHLFRSDFIRKQIKRCVSGVTRFNVSKTRLASLQLPVPPLEVQREIVETLDNFTLLSAELSAELSARKKQFIFYRKQIFDRIDNCSEEKLENICDLLDTKRKPVSKGNRTKGQFPYYGANGIQDYIDDYIFDGEFVLVGEDGSVINEDNTPVVNWAKGKIWVNNHAHIIKENEKCLLRYIYHYLHTINVRDLVHGNIPKITQGDFRSLIIKVPDLSKQKYIVNILDNFNSLCNDISSGLPAEIEARQKQYEHYRDKLLTFKRLEA